jgi:hypothetical protein
MASIQPRPRGYVYERVRAQSALFIMRSRVKYRPRHAMACQKETKANANYIDRIHHIF